MKNFKFKINGNPYEVVINNIEDQIAEVEVNGTTYQIEVEKAIQTTKTPKLVRSASVPSTDQHPASARTSSPEAPKGGGNIKAPLPGVVLDVYVKEGDTVKIGQRLMMLEAMKMENNIDSDKQGTVVSIKKNKGDSVMEGDVLIVIG
ncbi:MAG: biotin/lipoyl-binding protein [Bacteroidales bacterium]|nr:biotin/lipoyl-binding protein [Bacteroidales bacterium]MDD3663854.1 biotin/lipoyl-binding protein [Bacteroidales bacterium]